MDTQFRGVGTLESGGVLTLKEGLMPYRNVRPSSAVRPWDLLAADTSVASLSAALGVSDQTIYNWRYQDAVDRGIGAGSRVLWGGGNCEPRGGEC